MNNIFVSWKQKIESRIISDLKSQYEEMTDIMEQYYKENQGLYDINRLL